MERRIGRLGILGATERVFACYLGGLISFLLLASVMFLRLVTALGPPPSA
jgi:hypothetical protein